MEGYRDPDFGLPGPIDQDVFVAVMRLANRIGDIPADSKVHFSVYELIELMSRIDDGTGYADVGSPARLVSEHG